MKSIYLVILSAFLTSCGGGDSSSEQPSGVTYSGVQQANLVSSLVVQPITNIPFRMVVSDNSVFITDTADQPVEARGTLSGNRFTATSNSSGSIDGITCTFNWTYSGTVQSNNVSGSISGPVTCVLATGNTVFNTSGSFSGTTGNSKALSSSSSILKATAQVIK